MSSILIVRRKILFMRIFNYKKLKHHTNTSYLTHILTKSFFIGFFQVKSLNSSNYVELQKQLTLLQLDMYISKKTNLNKQINTLSSVKEVSDTIVKGNILIIYSLDQGIFEKKEVFYFFDSMNKHIIPLYFYVCNRFLSLAKFLNLAKLPSVDRGMLLISMLVLSNCNMLNLLENKKLL